MLISAMVALIFQTGLLQVNAGIELYGGLKTGMTKLEANAALPDKERALTPNCLVKIIKHFEHDRLDLVILRSKWISYKNDCYTPMLDSLRSKYGPPAYSRDEPAVGGGIIAAGRTIVWKDGERIIELTTRGKEILLSYEVQRYREVEKVEGL